MADKKQISFTIRRLQRIKTWQLVVLLIFVGFIAATFLRLNNVEMVQRRTAVLNADKIGDQVAVKNRLIELQRYVTAHMNTEMGTIYLEAQYKRDSEAANAAAATESTRSDTFKKAQQICAPRYANLGHYSQAYQQCVITELNKFPSGSQLTSELKLPKADSYRHSFVSPLWSPDFAGVSILICFLIIILIVGRLIGLGVLKLILKTRYRGV